jgi:hypothetical protein
MDARLTKQPVASQQLHTTSGLTAAKSTTVTGDNNVFITAQCRIKSTSTKDQKNTDPSCGQWGKPWPKDAYMSGESFVSSQIRRFLSSDDNAIFQIWQRFLTTIWQPLTCAGLMRWDQHLLREFLFGLFSSETH